MDKEREVSAPSPRQIFEKVFTATLLDGKPRQLLSFLRNSEADGVFSIGSEDLAGPMAGISDREIISDFADFVKGYFGPAKNFAALKDFLLAELNRKIEVERRAKTVVHRLWKSVNPNIRLKGEIIADHEGEIETWSLIPSLSFRAARIADKVLFRG